MGMKSLLKIVLVVLLMFSVIVPSVFAHDELGDRIDKGEGDFDNSNLVPILEGSKNVKFLKETGTADLSIIREDGKKNNSADVYAHKGFAYLGTHTAGGANGGVRVFDLKDPSNPVEVAVFANEIPYTWQEKVIVKTVNTADFKGDLAVVSVQQTSRNNVNRPTSTGGFLLYDVTNPYEPQKLGFWELDRRVRGTHELYLTTQGNRALVLTANPYADYFTHGEQKDFQMVDVSDPANPTTIYQWDPRDLPEVPDDFNGYHWSAPDGKTRPAFNHSNITNENGTTAYLSFWDLGTVILDISNPENPVYLGRTEYASDQKGAAHSAALARGGNILIETREVANPVGAGYESAYGYTRILDISDKTTPVLLSEFKTELTEDVPPTSAYTFAKTVHDPKVQGNTLYLSYYAGGVRIVDITDPSNPVEIGKYVPENSFVWGVFVDRNYILASDMDSGLKVLQKNNSNNNK
jgi:hypothetical protein